MENIFNEPPTNTNSNCKFMDHMYCHPDEGSDFMPNSTINSKNNSAIATGNSNNNSNNNNNNSTNINNNNNNSNSNENTNNSNNNNNNHSNVNMSSTDESEIMLKENKNFKSMLLLHFDLIQQQAEDLCVKEGELKLRTEECERLRIRTVQLEAQVLELQQQLEEQMKRVIVKRTSLPPPPLAKIQCLSDCVSSTSSTISKVILANTTTTAAAISNSTNATTTTATNSSAGNDILNKTTTTATTKSKLINTKTTITNKSTICTTPPPFVIKEDIGQTINTKLKIESKDNSSNIDATVNLTKSEEEEDDDDGESEHIKLRKTSNIIKVEQKTDDNKSNFIIKGNPMEIIENNVLIKVEQKVNDQNLEIISNKLVKNENNQQIICNNNNDSEVEETSLLTKLEKPDCIKQEYTNVTQIKRTNSTISLKTATTTSSDTTNCFSSIHSSTSCSSPSSTTTLLTNSGKRRRLWHASDLVTDEESMASFESTLDIETRSTTRTTPLATESCLDDTATGSCASSMECCEQEDCSITSESVSSLTSTTTASDQPLKKPRYLYYTASSPYLSRPWQEEELDGDVDEDVAEALRAAIPKLEIPKWTEHDITPLYTIEGTEDLSDDIFLKRHNKLELDEKRRKKWDVQQIREQRRLEKLRKRHCKDELIQGPVIQSFFPLAEELETICFVDMLPVQAFGEPIPILPHNGEGFRLPWLVETDGRPLPPPKKATEFYRFGLKKMTRREEKLWEETMDEAEEMEQKIEEMAHNQKNKELFEQNKELVVQKQEQELSESSKTDIESKSNSNNVNPDMHSLKVEESGIATTTINANKLENNNRNNDSKVEDDNKQNSCDIEETLNKNKLTTRIADCCYASSMVMLAKNGRQCASRTQMRKRLRYSSYIYLTKRKRQISLSTNTNKCNNNSNSNINSNNVNNSNNCATTTTTTLTTNCASTTTTASAATTSKININKNIPAFRTNNIVKTTTTTTNTRKITRQINATATTTPIIKNTHDKILRTTHNTDRTKENDKITITTTTTASTTNNINNSNRTATTTNKVIPDDKLIANDMITAATSSSLTTTTTTSETATILVNNNLKTKLRNLRVSLSPCNSNSNSSNCSTNISDSITMKLIKTTTPTQTSTSLNVNITTPTSYSNSSIATTTITSSTSTSTPITVVSESITTTTPITTTNTVVVAKTK